MCELCGTRCTVDALFETLRDAGLVVVPVEVLEEAVMAMDVAVEALEEAEAVLGESEDEFDYDAYTSFPLDADGKAEADVYDYAEGSEARVAINAGEDFVELSDEQARSLYEVLREVYGDDYDADGEYVGDEDEDEYAGYGE